MRKWSEKSGPMEWSVTILLVLGEIIRSKVLPWTWVGEVTYYTRLNEVRNLFKDWIIGVLGMLKSPSMIVLEMIVGRNKHEIIHQGIN